MKAFLEPFLPTPWWRWIRSQDVLLWDDDRPQSIGKVQSFHGNFGVIVRAFTYMRSMGPDGLRTASEHAVLNATTSCAGWNPCAGWLDRTCMHVRAHQ